MELPNEAWIIIYAWHEPSDWIGSFPSNLYQQILTDDYGKLPRHFDSFDEAAIYAENESLINPLIIPIAGKRLCNGMISKPHCALAQKSVGKKIFNYGLIALKYQRRTEIVLAANGLCKASSPT